MGFYKREDLQKIGFAHIGKDVQISDRASIYGASQIYIGDNVRIDDYCIISSGKEGIHFGNNIHVACFCSLIGQEKIVMEDFSGLSSKVSIYSSTDDYSGKYLTNPTVDSQFTNVISKPVHLGKHVIVGASSIILPGVVLETGVAVGALSLVTKSFSEFLIIGGTPAKVIKERNSSLVELEKKYKSLRNDTV